MCGYREELTDKILIVKWLTAEFINTGDTAQVADVNSQASAPKSYPRLRTRGRLTDYQKNVLERLFVRSPYLTSNQCVEVAAVLGIPKPALQVRF